jgi:hypothetical protein
MVFLSFRKMAHDRLPLRLPFAPHQALRPFTGGALAAPAAHLRSPVGRRRLRRHRGRGGFFTRAAAADHPRGDDSWSRAGPQSDADRPPDAGSAPCRRRCRSGRHKIHPALVEDCRPARPLFRPAPGFQLVLGVDGSATSSILEARKSRQDETRLRRRRPRPDPPRRVPIAPCQLSKCLKTLKTARASYWLKLAWIWDPRHRRGGLS